MYSPSRKSWLNTSSPPRYVEMMVSNVSFVMSVTFVLTKAIGTEVDWSYVIAVQRTLAFGFFVSARYETCPRSKMVWPTGSLKTKLYGFLSMAAAAVTELAASNAISRMERVAIVL